MSCTHCHAPTADGITLCPKHEADLSRLLNGLDDTLEDADTTIAKLDQLGGGAGTNDPAAGSAAPLNLEAMNRKRALVEAIHQWARAVLEDDTDPHVHGLAPLTYLRLSVDQIRRRDDAGELLREISEANRYLLVAIDRPPSYILLGQCGTTIDGQRCPAMIRARDKEPEVRCRTCGATYMVDDVIEARFITSGAQLRPLAVVVRALNHMGESLRLDTAKKWVTRGKLKAIAIGDDGVALYTPAQVHKIILDKRKVPQDTQAA